MTSFNYCPVLSDMLKKTLQSSAAWIYFKLAQLATINDTADHIWPTGQSLKARPLLSQCHNQSEFINDSEAPNYTKQQHGPS